MIEIRVYNEDGTYIDRPATPEEEADIIASNEEYDRPFKLIREQIEESNAILDDIVLLMADIIGGV